MTYEVSNHYAEQNVIGSMLKDSENIDAVTSYLPVESFYSSEHRSIYKSILELRGNNEPVDVFSVQDKAKSLGLDVTLGYLTDIELNTPQSVNALNYARHVIDKQKEREMILACEKSIAKIKSGEGSTSERLHHSIANVSAINPDASSSSLHSKIMDDVAMDWIGLYEERIENPDVRGLTTGMHSLDEIIGYRGLQGGDLIVIAARPKSFKTATMTKISNHIGVDLKKPVLTFSMEMQNNQMFERILTQETGITSDKFHRTLSDENNERVHNAVRSLRGTEMYIDDRSSLSMMQIKLEVRGRVKELGGYGSVGAIMIDYFTLMSMGENKASPSFAYAQMSKELVSLGKEVGVPIFLLSQLNRKCEERPDKRPLVSDLGDTDQLGRDASLIIMLYNDSVYHEDSPQKGLLEVIVRANRHGGTGTAFQTTTGGRLGDIGDEEMGRKQAEFEYQNKKKDQKNKYGA